MNFSAKVAAAMALSAGMFVSPKTAHADPPPAAASEAEENIVIEVPRVRGTKANTLATAGGLKYVFASDKGIPFLFGMGEYQLNDVLAVRMGGGIPIASARDNITLLPGQVGGTLHLLTRSTVDPFLGGDAGMAIALNKEHGTKLIPYVSGSLGARIYLTNFLMFQLEGGYQFMSYGGYGHFTNLNGPFATAMGGFSF